MIIKHMGEKAGVETWFCGRWAECRANTANKLWPEVTVVVPVVVVGCGGRGL